MNCGERKPYVCAFRRERPREVRLNAPRKRRLLPQTQRNSAFFVSEWRCSLTQNRRDVNLVEEKGRSAYLGHVTLRLVAI